MTMILDYANMLFGLIFGASSYRVQMFVSNQKYWYLVSEVFGLISTCVTVLAPTFDKDQLIYFLIFGKIVCAMSSIIGNCCRAPLVTHLARDNNFADCAAKEGN